MNGAPRALRIRRQSIDRDDVAWRENTRDRKRGETSGRGHQAKRERIVKERQTGERAVEKRQKGRARLRRGR